jgi:phosphoribosyl 1,2-cyclic phosphodiesterase
LTAGNTCILIDAGLSYKELARRLALAGEQPERLQAVLVTHEHSDHVAGLARLARKQPQIVIYTTIRTAAALSWDGCTPRVEAFQAGCRFCVGGIDVESFTIPHDAIDPVGFCFHAEGIKIGVATDLGYVTDSVRVHLRGTHALLLEANHDLEMLKVGPYPWMVKQRVMSRVGHLSNDGMHDFVLRDFAPSAPNLVLGHLSEHNNHPEIVKLVANQALERRGLSARLVVASQKTPTEAFEF